jgi:acyl carrier protein
MNASAVIETRMDSKVPPKFAARTVEEIKADLVGFPVSCREAALRFHAGGDVNEVIAMLPGIIEFHLPGGATKPPAELADGLRLNQDIGLDSLSLTEMAFKMDDLFGIDIEIREIAGVETVGDLKAFILRKLGSA